jgi:hypothetical protein
MHSLYIVTKASKKTNLRTVFGITLFLHRDISDISKTQRNLGHPRKEAAPAMKVILYSLILGTCLSVAAEPAQAALGGFVETVESDRQVLAAVRGLTTVSQAYTIQEIVSDAITVREYVSPTGIVFGLAWNGLVYPDLAQLLGPYADEYQKAMAQVPRQPGSRYAQVKTNRVVVDKWGHMRNLQGRAYVPDLMPQGVSVSDIK